MLEPSHYRVEDGESFIEKGDIEDNRDPESKKVLSPFAEGYEEEVKEAVEHLEEDPGYTVVVPGPPNSETVNAYVLFQEENALCVAYSECSPTVFRRSRDQQGRVWDFAFCNRCYMFAMERAHGPWTIQRTPGEHNFFKLFDRAHWLSPESAGCWDEEDTMSAS